MSVNPDRVEQTFEENSQFIQDLLVRINQQDSDIEELTNEIDKLSTEIKERE